MSHPDILNLSFLDFHSIGFGIFSYGAAISIFRGFTASSDHRYICQSQNPRILPAVPFQLFHHTSQRARPDSRIPEMIVEVWIPTYNWISIYWEAQRGTNIPVEKAFLGSNPSPYIIISIWNPGNIILLQFFRTFSQFLVRSQVPTAVHVAMLWSSGMWGSHVCCWDTCVRMCMLRSPLGSSHLENKSSGSPSS